MALLGEKIGLDKFNAKQNKMNSIILVIYIYD